MRHYFTPRALGIFSLVIAATCLLIVGCSLLLTGTTDAEKVAKIMEATNARGCIYTRVSASPWASAVTYMVGTWGDSPPSLDDCWNKLPPNAP